MGWRVGGEEEGSVERKQERGESYKLPGPVSGYWVTDVLFTLTVAFHTLSTDLDRYTCMRTLRGRSCTSTRVRTLMHD